MDLQSRSLIIRQLHENGSTFAQIAARIGIGRERVRVLYHKHVHENPPHELYKTGDPDVPRQIVDRNGEVVLGCCRICGLAEVELLTAPYCHPRKLDR